MLVVRDGLRSRAARWDHGLGAAFCDTGAKAIRVIALISEQVLERKTADQVFGLEDVVHLAWGQDEADVDCRGHRHQCLSSYSGRRANARSPHLRSPLFCTGRMLMRPHDGGVDDQVFEVRIFNQRIEKTLPNALLCPSAEALEHAVPVAKLLGQIAPWCSRANQPKHSVHEQSIILAVPPSVTFLTRNKRLDAPPLLVRK